MINLVRTYFNILVLWQFFWNSGYHQPPTLRWQCSIIWGPPQWSFFWGSRGSRGSGDQETKEGNGKEGKEKGGKEGKRERREGGKREKRGKGKEGRREIERMEGGEKEKGGKGKRERREERKREKRENERRGNEKEERRENLGEPLFSPVNTDPLKLSELNKIYSIWQLKSKRSVCSFRVRWGDQSFPMFSFGNSSIKNMSHENLLQ